METPTTLSLHYDALSRDYVATLRDVASGRVVGRYSRTTERAVDHIARLDAANLGLLIVD